MSRGQSTQAFNTSSGNSSTDQGNAENAFGSTTNSISDYNDALAKFTSGNPYTAGGEYDQTINTGLANTSDAGSNSLKGALQAQSLRTGQNSAADAATAASGAEANTRALSGDLAQAQQSRMNAETGYNTTALQGETEPISANSSLYSTSLGGANSAENTATDAAKTPSFWDEVGNAGVGALGSGATDIANNIFKGSCWVAAELFGGWHDPRVHLVRGWIFGPFARTWWGAMLAGFYQRNGRRLAAMVRRHQTVRWVAEYLFNKALVRAQERK